MAVDRDRSKSSLITLDWLRGIAALCVMFYHYFQHGPLHVLFPRAFLAVDFFFMLSGFVLAYRYGCDIPRSFGTLKFIGVRLRRLYPLYIVGTLLGGAALFVDVALGRTPGFHWKEWQTSGVLALFFQPYLGHFGHFALDIGTGRIDAPAFPFNVPAWSLFFELIANVIMALVVLTYRRLLLIVVPAFVLLCCTDLFYRDTNVGWGFSEFFGGFPRIMVCFFVGVLLERIHDGNLVSVPKISPYLIAGLLALDLSLPNIAHLGVPQYIFSIAILFPALILAGAENAPRSGNGGALSFLGRISYALYMVHFPILDFSDLIVRKIGVPLDGPNQAVVVALSAGTALALAAALTLWFDEPLRRMGRGRSWRRLPASRAGTPPGPVTPLASDSPSRP